MELVVDFIIYIYFRYVNFWVMIDDKLLKKCINSLYIILFIFLNVRNMRNNIKK
jgi:hypothetical protein